MKSIAPWRAAVVSGLGLLAACSSTALPTYDAAYEPMPQEPAPVDTGTDIGDAPTIDGSRCAAVIEQHADEGAVHVSCTSAPEYGSVPPSSGNHFGCWPEYRTFSSPVPWGNLVHALEHGAVVIVFNCGGAGQECIDDIARAQAFIDALPPDPACGAARRIILAPDPTLPVRWAASAWTWTLQADCFDATAFGLFVAEHLGHGRESVCGGGAPYANLCDGSFCL